MSLSQLTATHAPARKAAVSTESTPEHGHGHDQQGRSRLTLDDLFGKSSEFKTEPWGPARWLRDGSAYTILETSNRFVNSSIRDIVYYDTADGTRRILVAAEDLIPAGMLAPLAIKDYAWHDSTGIALISTSTRKVWRYETRGDYWIFDTQTRLLRQLGAGAERSSLMFATLSPDGTNVAYVYQNNIYVQHLEDMSIARLTSDGNKTTINGTADWVYEEEFFLRNGLRWSPDGKHLAYWQFDTADVREFQIVNNTASSYPEITSYAYPKVGETNAACRVGVVKASGSPTQWFPSDKDPRNHYIPKMEWSEDSQTLVFQQLNRLQNINRVFCWNPETGETDVVFTDTDEAWVDVMHDWRWIENGQRFLWLSERGGWRQLHAVSPSDQSITLLTPGEFDVIQLVAVNEQLGCVYFIASPDNPTQRHLYRVPLDGSGALQRVSPTDQAGSHSYETSPDGCWAFHHFSRFGEPPRIELVTLEDHKVLRTLTDNSALRKRLAETHACPSEFIRLEIGGNVQLDAWCMFPPDFDPNQQYPLLIHVYGEPVNSTVVDRWGGETYLWHRLLAQRGCVVMSIDNRGTNAPRGRAWRKSIYRQIGIQAPADQAAATREFLRTRPFIDPKRVAIWGHSGGGSMSLHAIFREPDLYSAAMALSFVSDQKLYDTIYQERYMGLPKDNPQGYRDGSPITHAHQLRGKLLLAYGTADDNCHYQNCELLINELIRHNKQFSLMAYPNRSHDLSEGENTRRHLHETLTRFLEENLHLGA